jgi:plasmid stabilization system protein ParE
VRVHVLESAVEDLEAIHAYIARNNPRAADSFIEGIRAHIRRVAETGFGEIGRPGTRRDTRELVHGRYVIVYQLDDRNDELVALAVIHGARRR